MRRRADVLSPGCVDHDVGAGADRGELCALAADTVGDIGLAGERMAPARGLVAVQQLLVLGLEEQDATGHGAGVELVEHRGQLAEVLAAARVAHHAGALPTVAPSSVNIAASQACIIARRQVVTQ